MFAMKKTFAGAALVLGIMTAAPLTVWAAEADDASAEAAPAEAVALETAAPAATPAVGMPNPIVKYRTVQELELAIGFPVFYLPGNLNSIYHPAVSIYGISGLVADLRFQSNRDDSTLMVRSALIERVHTEDISGHHSVTWSEIDGGDLKHTKVKVATLGPDAYTAHWKAGRFCYALDMTAVKKETFLRFLKSFVSTGDRFAFNYRDFKLNTQNVEKIRREAEAVSNPEAAAQLEADNKAQAEEQAKNDQSAQKKEWYY